MKIWARMLADLPPTLHRLIARSQRISLPRSCLAPARLTRLRAALCRQRTVRVTSFALLPAVHEAVQELRAIPRGLSPAALTARSGPIRPWSQIRASPRSQRICEPLVLLDWLVPRPATPRHPTRSLLPPELRAALPRPFTIATYGPAAPPRGACCHHDPARQRRRAIAHPAAWHRARRRAAPHAAPF